MGKLFSSSRLNFLYILFPVVRFHDLSTGIQVFSIALGLGQMLDESNPRAG
jgi:hypothetical protein